MLQTTACFLLQGQRGGCNKKSAGGVTSPLSLNSFVFRGLSLLIGFQCADTEKSEETIETIATPQKRGVPTGPDSGPLEHARYPAPGGRYRRYLSLREGSELPPRSGALSSALPIPSTAAPRFPSPWMIPDRSSPSRVRFAALRPGLLRADPKGIAVYEGKRGVGF